MKNAFHILFILCAFAPFCFGQDKTPPTENKWTRIETVDKESSFSLSLPPDFLVDKEDKKYRVFAYQQGVTMRVEFDAVGDGKERLRQIRRFSPAKVSSFALGNFVGDVHEHERRAKGFSTQIYATSSKGFYTISIYSKDAQSPLLEKFLYSIRLDERPLYKREGQTQSNEETKIAITGLTTSPVILEALKKEDASKIRLEQDLGSKEKPGEAEAEVNYSRPLILLRQPRPTSVRRERTMEDPRGTVRLKILFLADGTIGGITVLNRPDNGYMKSAADAARRIKFLPAEIDGKPIDVTRIIDYNFF